MPMTNNAQLRTNASSLQNVPKMMLSRCPILQPITIRPRRRLIPSKEVCVNLGGFVNLHFHLETIEFLLDLLSKHWSQAITSSNVPTPVILLARPSVMKLYARTKVDILDSAMRRIGCTLRIAMELGHSEEVVLAFYGD